MKFSVAFAALTTLLAGVVTANPLEARACTKLTQSQAESRLRAAGITWTSSGGCTDKTKSTCTSFDGVCSTTVDGAITLHSSSACNCALTITGGTETGHASGTYSHANGYKFDFRKTTTLDSYIKNHFARIADRGDGYPQWQAASGNIYCDEGSHWDVTFY